MTDQYSMYDAAYLLGALSPADRSAYEAHLADCPDCRRAVNHLAGLPGLLASVTPDQARAAGEPVADVPETLLPRLMAEVQRTRFRRRLTTALVGVAAAAVLAISLVAGLRDGSPAENPGGHEATPVALHMTPLSDRVPIRATARLEQRGWGTQVVVHCVYQGSAGSHQYVGNTTWPTFTMVVTDSSGDRQQIGAWQAKPGAPIVVEGYTSVSSSQIATIQVLDTSHTPILRLRL